MSARFSQSGNIEYVGNPSDPDIIYYNASIVNNATDDARGLTEELDPPIRFNETRDTYIVRDASKYQFSIVRFVVNGANTNLPIFIPAIQSYTGQTNVNLTEYGLALTWNGVYNGTVYAIAPDITYVEYRPETINPFLAPLPRNTANPRFVGLWNNTTAYEVGDIVSALSTTEPPYFSALRSVPAGTPLTNKAYWGVFPDSIGQAQDLTSRYYYVFTYTHWVELVNETFVVANTALWDKYRGITGDVATYPTYAAWALAFPPPQMEYDVASGLFSILFPLTYQSSQPLNATAQNLFFNANMEGIFANFKNFYFNEEYISPSNPGANWNTPPATATPYEYGYTYAIRCSLSPSGYNIFFPLTISGASSTTPLLRITQDFCSTTSLWSPIENITFTSTLLPIQNEQVAPPNALGTRNTGISTATAASAFTPIITDVAIPLSAPEGAAAYRQMIYYTPTSEYRMADFQNSKQDIRNIDVQVFWKNRLDNNLYPLTMFNLSSVSIKLMFRKKSILSKSERSGGY